MKKIFKYIMLGVVLVASSSCKKYLDINTNPNSFTSATPAIVLPQAIVGAASISNNFNISLADFSGARANAGGFGGFGSTVTYNFGTNDYAGLWTASYDNANDFEYIINSTSSDPTLAYSTGIARIMKAFAFERLVNQFNNVPYTDALKGTASLQPKYDDAVFVYKACIAELTKAVTDITTAQAATAPAANVLLPSTDPMFGGNMNLWKQFAQTVKLRMLIKMAGVPAHAAYATAEFAKLNASIGYLTVDALVQPGYEKTNRPTPVYSSLGFSTTGTNVTTSRIPTKWIFSFYNGTKLSDGGRGSVIYRSFPSTPTNQMGDESTGVPAALSAGSAWNTGTNATNNLGVAKGPTQAQPVMLAAEVNFLLAEAYARNYLTGGSDEAQFNSGITNSFTYLYKTVAGTVDASKNVAADVATYVVNNTGTPFSGLVIYPTTGTLDQKLEAIITQKYIALNMVNNDENFNEFRRTGFPKIVNGSLDPLLTFASRQSISSHIDKLPTRVLYPQEEYNLNPTNAPAGINKFSSLIFWDLN
jgi:hypothetical protein